MASAHLDQQALPRLATAGELTWDTSVLCRGRRVDVDWERVEIMDSLGGSAAIVAHNAAILGGSVRFIGVTGDDQEGQRAETTLVNSGVDVQIVQRAGRTTRILLIVDDSGGRTARVDESGRVPLEVRPGTGLAPALQGLGILHLESWGLFDPASTTAWVELALMAKRMGARLSMDACSATRVRDTGPAKFFDWLRVLQPEILFANEEEAKELGMVERSPPGVTRAVVHRGSNPVRIVDSSGLVCELPVGRANKVLDTSGAGDTFAAGYLLSTLGGHSPGDAAAAGNLAAAQVIGMQGCLLPPRATSTEVQ